MYYKKITMTKHCIVDLWRSETSRVSSQNVNRNIVRVRCGRRGFGNVPILARRTQRGPRKATTRLDQFNHDVALKYLPDGRQDDGTEPSYDTTTQPTATAIDWATLFDDADPESGQHCSDLLAVNWHGCS